MNWSSTSTKALQTAQQNKISGRSKESQEASNTPTRLRFIRSFTFADISLAGVPPAHLQDAAGPTQTTSTTRLPFILPHSSASSPVASRPQGHWRFSRIYVPRHMLNRLLQHRQRPLVRFPTIVAPIPLCWVTSLGRPRAPSRVSCARINVREGASRMRPPRDKKLKASCFPGLEPLSTSTSRRGVWGN